MQLNIMIYSVRINHGSPFEDGDHTFADAYMQGCERTFSYEAEAREYLGSFEEWEQDLLVIDALAF
jgi:hypothetical protein|tara:strand:+ start:386 stop:583 length:198 start_codon:yes stop_codon:yes gene_type:complete